MDVINYVMQSPENTNPNVLRGLLENNGASPSGELIKYNTVTIKNVSDENIYFEAPHIVDQGVIMDMKKDPMMIPSKTNVIINFVTIEEDNEFHSALCFYCDEGFTIEASDLSGWEKQQKQGEAVVFYFNESTPLVDQNLVVTVNVNVGHNGGHWQ